MKRDQRCIGCKYNRICNGYTMSEENRCPEWVISEFLKTFKPVGREQWTMKMVIDSNRK